MKPSSNTLVLDGTHLYANPHLVGDLSLRYGISVEILK